MSLSAHSDAGEPFGRYRLIERLGAGGMAVVYRALLPTPQGEPSVVVIKRVLPTLSRDPVFVKMLVAEARLSSRLRHPGIVRMHELGRVRDEYFLTMEYVDGADLMRLLNRCVKTRTPVPIGIACYVAQQVATALAYAHQLKDAEGRPLEIVHRDVSPANVMVTVDGQIKLLDFGVAKAAEHVRDDRTRTGTLKGKINYLSPEQAEGLTVDGRSDLFALGIVLHECLTLRRLFKGASDLVTLRMVRQCEVAPPSHLRAGVPPELDTIVLRMLARDPRQRFSTGDEIAAALAPLVEAHGGTPEALAELFRHLQPLDAPALIADDDESNTEAVLDLEIVAHEDVPEEPNAAAEPNASAEAQAASQAQAASEGQAAAEAQAASEAQAVSQAQAASQAPPTVAPAPELDPASQLDPQPKPQRGHRPIGLWAGAALLLVGGAVLVASSLHAPRPAPLPPAIVSRPAVAAPPPVVAPPAPPAPAAPVARIAIELDAPAAQIWLDGALVADGVRRARIPVAQPGQHQLRVVAPRRRPYQRTIAVVAGADLDLRLSLARQTSSFSRAKVRTADGDYLVDPFGPKR